MPLPLPRYPQASERAREALTAESANLHASLVALQLRQVTAIFELMQS